MKKQLLKPMMVLTAAVGTTLLTGCASMNQGSAQTGEAVNSLAFTSVTNPKELVKWSDNTFLQRSLQSVDTYYFEVPVTSGEARNEAVVNEPSSNYRESSGAAPGRYQSESGAYRVIRYRPGGMR